MAAIREPRDDSQGAPQLEPEAAIGGWHRRSGAIGQHDPQAHDTVRTLMGLALA